MSKLFTKQIKLWQLVLPLLVISNVVYFSNNLVGAVVTLSFFLFVPGWLLLNRLKHGIKSRWEIATLSLGLSVLLMMVGGLALNGLHMFGLDRPLEAFNILLMLNLSTLILLVLNKMELFTFPHLRLKPTLEEFGFISALTILPILAITGAIRLNNGASNIITMILFALIPLIFMLLIWRNNMKHLYPYAVFMFGLAILLTTSLRGWQITGHDIQHEFRAFEVVLENALWSTDYRDGPYNACLSITILPAIISKLTVISVPYIYKVIFQLIFAFSLLSVYFFTKKLSDSRIALIAVMLFVSFPTFLNDIPFLNRQEMAFMFFGLLLMVNAAKISYRPKMILTVFFIAGLLLSHYSSNYITIGLFMVAWAIYTILVHRKKYPKKLQLPILSLPVLLIAFLMTFIWNAQVTSTAPRLESVFRSGIKTLKTGNFERSSGVSYGLFGANVKSPEQVLHEYAGDTIKNGNNEPTYFPEANMPLTSLGSTLTGYINIESINKNIRLGVARTLQFLLVVGLVILYLRQRKGKSQLESYYYALSMTCFVMLLVMTVVPGLTVMYGITRLFQQTLIITSLPIIIATAFMFGFFKKTKIYAVAGFYAFLFLHLSGFIPQTLGGYPPQLALNNAGVYYDVYYKHKTETIAAIWLTNIDSKSPIIADSYAAAKLPNFPLTGRRIINPIFKDEKSAYIYDDYANINRGLYASFISGNVIEYSVSKQSTKKPLIYANQSSRVYGRQ